MAIMFVMESHLAKQELKLKLIKKIVHLSVSEFMSNSDRMVLLHLNIKSFALDLHRIIVIQTSFITYVIEIPTSYLKFEIKKTVESHLGVRK